MTQRLRFRKSLYLNMMIDIFKAMTRAGEMVRMNGRKYSSQVREFSDYDEAKEEMSVLGCERARRARRIISENNLLKFELNS